MNSSGRGQSPVRVACQRSQSAVMEAHTVQHALLPPLKKEVMFLVRSVCLFVCLSVGLLANL